MGKDYCWFDVCIGGTPQKERIVMELFDDVVPQTCRNFRQLCLGNNGEMVTRTNGSQTPMTYKNSIFHRVIKGFMIQGGDFTKRDGTGGVSIYGEKFEDENFELPCDKSGLLAMANAGRNTNGSQFFITVAPASHLTGKHVVFGRVVRGMNTVRNIEHVSTGVADRPTNECCVVDCGTVDTLEDVVPPADGDVYPEYACDVQPSLNDKGLMEAAEKIRQIGSSHFQSGSFEIAAEKYVKAASYLAEVKESLVDEKVLNEQKVACNNNAAMCYLKLQQWSAAHKSATKALKYDPNNTKALFRRATAFLHLNDATGAVADLREAQRLEPQNADVAAKLNEAKAMDRAQKEKMASRFKTMFS